MKVLRDEFPTLQDLRRAAATTYKTVKADKARAAVLVRTIEDRLASLLMGHRYTLDCDISYDHERRCNGFGVTVRVRGLPKDEKLDLLFVRQEGTMCFGFKLDDDSRQNTIGLLDVDGEDDNVFVLDFQFVEW